MSYEDKTIVCVDCGAEFTFTADEQQRFAEQRLHQRSRSACKACRDAKESPAGRSDTGGGRGGYGGGGGGGGGRGGCGGGGGGGGSGPAPRCSRRLAHDPKRQADRSPRFKPSGSRFPVYCRDWLPGPTPAKAIPVPSVNNEKKATLALRPAAEPFLFAHVTHLFITSEISSRGD